MKIDQQDNIVYEMTIKARNELWEQLYDQISIEILRQIGNQISSQVARLIHEI